MDLQKCWANGVEKKKRAEGWEGGRKAIVKGDKRYRCHNLMHRELRCCGPDEERGKSLLGVHPLFPVPMLCSRFCLNQEESPGLQSIVAIAT